MWSTHQIEAPSSVSSLVVSVASEETKRWQDWLSQEERDVLSEYTVLKRRSEFIAGRAAARQLLAQQLSCDPGEVPLRITPSGAVLVDIANWSVSIAHSGEWAVAACAQHPIGVDMERITPRTQNVERFLLHTDDQRYWPDNPSPADFARWWVLKEAVLKARHSGLRMMASRLRLVDNPATTNPVTISEPEGVQWSVWSGRFSEYPWAIALPRAATPDASP